MKGINLTRVVLGGLLAGLVINVGEFLFNAVLFAAEMDAALKQLGLPPMGGSTIALFVVLCFLLGIGTVWLYAAIRPRFGPGVSTALQAGAAVWVFAYLFPSIGYAAMGIYPTRLVTIGAAWGAVEVLIAAVAGAWLYREEPTAAPRHAGV